MRELAEARNTAENAAYQAERQLSELGDAVDASSREEIEAAIKEVRESLTSENAEEIRSKAERMQTAFHRVSEAMYERAQAQQAGAGATNGAGQSNGAGAADEEVVDAEVVDEQR